MLDLYAASESFHYLLDLAIQLISCVKDMQEPSKLSISNLIKAQFDVDLSVQPIDHALAKMAASLQLDQSSPSCKVIDAYIERYVETKAKSGLWIIHDYPVGGTEPYAKRQEASASVSNRFEVFVDGIEVAHGYEDETDLVSMRARAESQQLLDDDMQVISNMVSKQIIPARSVGLGLGIERLCMASYGGAEIQTYRFGTDF